MVVAILKLQPPRLNAGEDTPRWIKSSDREFSTSSAYDLIIDHHNQEGDWGWIWKLKFPQKLKSFLWLVFHEKIPTNKMRNLRGLISDPNCPYCANVEDIEHLLWFCPQAIQIWCRVYSKEWTRRHGGGGGFGGLFGDEIGAWISRYYGRLEIYVCLEPELWAVYKGRTIILQRGFNQVIIEMDAKQVTKLLSDDLGERCPFRGIVEDARIIMRGCDCSILHIRREANICADVMAKLGEYQPADLLIVNEPPEELRTLFVADIVHLSKESDRM
ncbi:uncharacterized protein LOC114262983 [Camellia sinensis]|uniref:uncharacterized protein LOC114262983 n=1 Tax=Camellia sinensis TaxID=4442 RepID=UPI0010363F56|nr:uncharacterized protein LOC114262983 [Camellia sinensis]